MASGFDFAFANKQVPFQSLLIWGEGGGRGGVGRGGQAGGGHRGLSLEDCNSRPLFFE